MSLLVRHINGREGPNGLLRRARWRAASPGQTMVEFALTAVVLFAAVFGVVEFGRAIYDYSAVANTAREAARYAAIHPTGDVAAYVAGLHPGVLVTVDPPVDGATVVTATARHTFTAITPFVPSIEMVSTAHAYIEVH